jgi:DUF4097 and DUF4098 domain-containing protein YvlB
LGAAARGPRTQLDIRVPTRSRVWLKTGNADVDVSGVTGGLDVNIVGGRVRVAGGPRELNVEAMDGDIEIAGPVPWLRAKSAAGNVTLRGSSEDVALSSVSGAVTVVGGTVTRGKFETVTGGIRFTGAVERNGSLDFDSHSGAVELFVPLGLSADFDVATISGTVTNELTRARAIPARDLRGRELGFSTGNGGAHITIRTFKGSVALRRK